MFGSSVLFRLAETIRNLWNIQSLFRAQNNYIDDIHGKNGNGYGTCLRVYIRVCIWPICFKSLVVAQQRPEEKVEEEEAEKIKLKEKKKENCSALTTQTYGAGALLQP